MAMEDTHRPLSVHTGHVDDGAFGLYQMRHAQLSQVVNRSENTDLRLDMT